MINCMILDNTVSYVRINYLSLVTERNTFLQLAYKATKNSA